MTPGQFDLIIDKRFPRLSPTVAGACRSVIIEGMSAYAAEDKHKSPRGTVNRYVNKIHAEFSLAIEISGNIEQKVKDILKDHQLWDGETAGAIAEAVGYE